MSFILIAGAAVGVGTGIAKAVGGAKQRREAEKERLSAEAEMEARKDELMGLDISNPFADMENVYEDLTVNQQQAEFEKQQFQQSQANILEGLKSAAGGSGVAALAQQLSQQGQIAAQQSAISIGQQEQANQQTRLAEEARLQDKFLQGELLERQAEKERTETLFGLAAADVEAAAGREAAGKQQMMSGIGDIGGALIGGATGLMGADPGNIGVDFYKNLKSS